MHPSPLNPATFRDRRNLALARASELAAPLLKAAASVVCPGRPTAPPAWRRGILIGADHIGDVLYNTASLPALAEAFPECEWHFVATAPASEVLANNPFIKSCIASPESLGPIDVAICYNSGGYWRDLIQSTRLGIPNRVGYVHKGFSALVTHPVTINYPQPFPVYFRDLVAQITDKPPAWPLRPKVFPNREDEGCADAVWQQLALDPFRPVLACFVTSRQALGVLPAQKFGATIQLLEKDAALQTILLGAPEDSSVLEELKRSFNLTARIAAGKLRLLPLVSFLRRCSAVYCTDSGPRHLANAAEVPALYIRNISFSKVEAGPYCETEFDLAPEVEFVPLLAQERIFLDLTPENMAAKIIAVVRPADT